MDVNPSQHNFGIPAGPTVSLSAAQPKSSSLKYLILTKIAATTATTTTTAITINVTNNFYFSCSFLKLSILIFSFCISIDLSTIIDSGTMFDEAH